MDWKADSELQEIFRTEMEERAVRLQAGGTAMAEGRLGPDLIVEMTREAHTIKGTARVMGYTAIAEAAQQVEHIWKAVQNADQPTGSPLGLALAAMAGAMLDASTADQQGTPELDAAAVRLTRIVNGDPDPDGSEQPATGQTDGPEAALPEEPVKEPIEAPIDLNERRRQAEGEDTEARVRHPEDPGLGGLLSQPDEWIREETTSVDTSKLYRLINRVAEVRLDGHALAESIGMLRRATTEPVKVAAVAAGWEELVETMAGALYDLQEQAVGLVAAPLRRVTDTLPGLVRYLAKKTGKDIRLEIVGDGIEIDRQILDRVADPLRHLVVNAIEHGIEKPSDRIAAGKPSTATLAVSADMTGGRIRVTVADDGTGLDWPALAQAADRHGLLVPPGEWTEDGLRALLFTSGLTTAYRQEDSPVTVKGLTLVARVVEDLQGSIDFQTTPGSGTTATLTLPSLRSLQRALMVRAGLRQWGIPDAAVVDRLDLRSAQVHATPSGREVAWRDGSIPLVAFAAAVGLAEPEELTEAVVVATVVGPIALAVPEVISLRDVAAKSLGPIVSGAPHVTAAALLGGGEVALMVDPNALGERARRVPQAPTVRPLVLVVDDSRGARELVAGALTVGGFRTLVAAGAAEALDILRYDRVDALVVDYAMPDTDGVGLVAQARARHADLPIVMVSAVAGPADQARALEAGVDVYIDKSDLREGVLASTLHDLVARRAGGGWQDLEVSSR